MVYHASRNGIAVEGSSGLTEGAEDGRAQSLRLDYAKGRVGHSGASERAFYDLQINVLAVEGADGLTEGLML